MSELLPKKNTRGKATDKVLVNMLIGIYKKDAAFGIVYKAISEAFDEIGEAQDKAEKMKKKGLDIIDTKNIKNPFANLDITQGLINRLFEAKPTEKIVLGAFLEKKYKANDVAKKYGVTPTTIKTRMKDYFDLIHIKEGRIKYLYMKPKIDVLANIVLYFYFKELDIRQNNMLRNITTLFENNN